MDLLSMLGGGGAPGGLGGMPMPGMGGPMGGMMPMMGGPGQPRPGQGMNAMSAMQGGLGMAPPAPSPMGVNGPNGLPMGGVDPGQGSSDQFGGSDLLAMLSQGGDQYDQPAGMPSLEDVGEDPTGGMNDPGGLMSLIAMAGLGVDPNSAMGGPMGMGGMGGMCGPGMPC
jgi:hypothetical protein